MAKDNTTTKYLITAASAQGGRKYMEDRLHIEVGRNSEGGLEFIFAAVYDGHGGVQASEYVRQHLFQNIVKNEEFFSDDDELVAAAIRSGFLRTHSNMQKAAEHWPPTTSGFPCTAGTTVTCAFIRNGKLYTGHVGDSSIVLVNFTDDQSGFDDVKLTTDHKPDSKQERLRIERAGGAVATKSGIFRVVWRRPMRGHRGPLRRSTPTENIPFLAVARSLGDFWSLNPDNNEYVVSPEPDVDIFRLKSSDDFIVIATDGLTNVVGMRAIVQILREVEQAKRRDVDAKNQQSLVPIEQDGNLPLNPAHCLLQHAFKKWDSLRADNISVICIKLNSDGNSEKPGVMLDDNEHPNPALDISLELTEHPKGIIRVNPESTERLESKFIRHRYYGALDKGLSLSASQKLLDRANNNNDTNSSKRRSQRQQSQEFYTGPGFIIPEMKNTSNDRLADNSSLVGSVGNGIADGGDSDAEETRTPSGDRLPVPGRNKSADTSPSNQPHGQQLTTLRHTPKGKSTGKLALAPKEGGTGAAPRQAHKRRYEETERYFTAKVSLEGEADEQLEEAKPPPAKRSRIQTGFQMVVNFFSSLFKWRSF